MIENEKPMRLAAGEALVICGKNNPAIVVLDADTSSSTQSRLFAEAFPDRFFNVGVSEANMVSVAAGLACTGHVPFVEGFAFLLALRAGDQVRSQIAYGNLNVKLVGGYCGLSDFADGASHQSIMDVAVMRALPNMTVLCCADLTEAYQMIEAASRHVGPVYIRVSRADCRRLFDQDTHPFEIGKAIHLKHGNDVTLIATGTMVGTAMEAAERLAASSIGIDLLEVHTIKPLDTEAVVRSAAKTGRIVTCEEHTIVGGLFSAVSETVAQHHPVPVTPIGIRDRFGETGTYAELLAECGLTCEHIVRTVHSLMRGSARS